MTMTQCQRTNHSSDEVAMWMQIFGENDDLIDGEEAHGERATDVDLRFHGNASAVALNDIPYDT